MSNTIRLGPGQKPAPGSIEALSWLAGHWKGEAFGGRVEESWSPPLAGGMMGMFRLIVNDQVSFYEFMTIDEQESSLVLRIKHFDPGLIGWEEKEERLELRLVRLDEGQAWFDGLTFLKAAPDELHIYLTSRGEDGSEQEHFFQFDGIRQAATRP